MSEPSCASSPAADPAMAPSPSPAAFLDLVFPGFSVLSAAIQRHLHVDVNVYIPLLMSLGTVVLVWQYISEYCSSRFQSYLMSKCTLRTDDEAYNYVMAWVAKQRFSRRSRRFIVNTNTNSRSWWTWRSSSEDDEGDEDSSERDSAAFDSPDAARKPLSYTPDFGSHYFLYKGRLLCFERSQGREQILGLATSEKEEIYISCFGRNPAVLKELLIEARDLYMKRDEKKTTIYRGTNKMGSTEPSWQRCMARTSRPFSTVILNEKVKQDLIDDVTDYLDPATRRWYSNRGIPYRRGYLLHGPPGTGKSSLSLALAGFFKMRIYIVSLSSTNANEETLSTLFAELPRRCVVLLEDIDSAGLTHTREAGRVVEPAPVGDAGADMVPGQITPGLPIGGPGPGGRISLSGLLNILDGVASQEGRVLIMTTNHVEKLDKALIRPGRVDMVVHFGRADRDMVASIFGAIYAPLEGDDDPRRAADKAAETVDADAQAKNEEAAKRKREETVKKVEDLAQQFADRIPAHEFSPAELQGFLMKHKRSPDAAVAGAEEWVRATRREKAEKELKEAEEKRRKEEDAAAEKKKKKEDEEKAEAKKEEDEKAAAEKKKRKARRRRSKKSKKAERDEDESDESLSSSSDSEGGNGAVAEAKKPVEVKKPAVVEAKKQGLGSEPIEPQEMAPVSVSGDVNVVTVAAGTADSGYET